MAALRGPVGLHITGGSPIQPEKGDRRFPDPAVTEHPIYYRVMQAYLALCAEVDTTVAEATCVERHRWRLPMLVGNPAALKCAFGSGGASMVLGLRNYLH